MRYYMLNKPKGLLTACSDGYKKTVMECFPEDEREGLFPIGRLDKDTVGLLIMTDDGKLCYSVANPTKKKTKTYVFYAKGTIDAQKIKLLEDGVYIGAADGGITAPAKAEHLGDTTLGEISDLIDATDPKLRLTRKADVPVAKVKLTITEGKKHQVKRMALAVGLRVVYLKRTEINGVKLDESLAEGEYRPLTEEELSALRG